MTLNYCLGQELLIYWSDVGNKSIMRSDLDGNDIDTIINNDLIQPYELLFIDSEKKLVWCDGTGKIEIANLDGSQRTVIQDFGLNDPRGLAYSPQLNKLYWTELGNSCIKRSNMDGSQIETLIEDVQEPHGLAIDTLDNKIYWADRMTNKIQRSDLNGNQVETILDSTLQNPAAIDLNMEDEIIYFSDSKNDAVYSMNYDGTNLNTLISNIDLPFRVKYYSGKNNLYITDYTESNILVYDLQQESIDTILNSTSGIMSPSGISIVKSPSNTGSNEPVDLELNFYPNPVSSKFYVDIPKYLGKEFEVNLYSVSGSKIFYTNKLMVVDDKISITLPSNIVNGIYFIEITNEQFKARKKIHLQRN